MQFRCVLFRFASFFFSSRRRHTRYWRDWSSDVCSSDLEGLRVMIGKGLRSKEVVDAIKQYKGVYFAAIGGAAALMGKCVKKAEVIAFEDLGPEAIRRLEVEELPVIVAIDSEGGDVYSMGRAQYARD